MVGTGTRNTGGVGYHVSSLKVAPRLLETRVSITNAGVGAPCEDREGGKCGPWAVPGEANH